MRFYNYFRKSLSNVLIKLTEIDDTAKGGLTIFGTFYRDFLRSSTLRTLISSLFEGILYLMCIVSQIWFVSCLAVLIEIAGKKVK